MRILLFALILGGIIGCTGKPGGKTTLTGNPPSSPSPFLPSPPSPPTITSTDIRGIWKQAGCVGECFYDELDNSLRTLDITNTTAVRVSYSDAPSDSVSAYISGNSLCFALDDGDQVCNPISLSGNQLLFCLDDFCEKYDRI